MQKFYYTYGCDHDFAGGWTEVHAENRVEADRIFTEVHPVTTDGFLPCAFCYTEECFKSTKMPTNGNFGLFCQEVLGRGIHMGVVITTDKKISIQGFDNPLYKSIGAAVDGYIEIVNPAGLNEPYCMIANEEGRLRKLPTNEVGSFLYGTHIHGHPIVGNIVIMKFGITDEGPDIVGLSTKEAHAFVDAYTKPFGLTKN